MNVAVLDRARRYVEKCSPAVSGQHGHNTTFRVACALVRGFKLQPNEAMQVFIEWNARCVPPWSESELQHKIVSAGTASAARAEGYLLSSVAERRVQRPCAFVSTPSKVTVPAKPVFEPDLLNRIAAKAPHVDKQFVKDRSALSPEVQTPASFLQRLYRPGESVIVFDVFQSQGKHVCECIELPYDANCLNHLINGCPDGVWFLCNPVDGKFHPNARQNGKPSRRSEESVTSWRYLVVESDVADPMDWLAALVQMPLRIAAIYTSGGQSIHALVRLDAMSKADWDNRARKLKPLLTILGADPAAMTAVRLTRLPGCYRGQIGPKAPATAPAQKRLVDEPLRFDSNGDPIWTPDRPPRDDAHQWTGGRLQELLYLDPEPDGTPIYMKPTSQDIYEKWKDEMSATCVGGVD